MRINWRHCRLGDLGEIRSGGTPATNKNEYWGGHIPWCTPTDITSLKGRFISSTERQITELGVKNSNAELLPPGSVIVCTRATIGEAAINTVPMATNQGFKSIIPTQDVDSDFLYYLVRSLKREFVRRAAGSTFLEISASSFAKIPVRIPDSLEVQRWLVRPLILLDDIAIALQDLIATKREFKRGLMQELLTGRRRFPEYADRDVEVVPLGQLCDIRIGGTPKRSMPQYWAKDGEEGFPWATIADLKSRWVCKTAERITQAGVNNSSAKLIPRGTTLMSFKLTIGRVARAGCDLYCNEAIAAFYPKTDVVLSAYLYEILPFAVRYANPDIAVKGATLNKAKLEELPIRLPQPDEQRRISKIGELLDLEIERLEQLHSLLTKQQRGLMQKLLTGELAVPVSSEPEPVHA